MITGHLIGERGVYTNLSRLDGPELILPSGSEMYSYQEGTDIVMIHIMPSGPIELSRRTMRSIEETTAGWYVKPRRLLENTP